MLNSFREISKTLRRGISLGLRTKVMHQSGVDGENVVELFTSFPENLALSFCRELSFKRVKPHGKGIVLTGANPDAYFEIFEWMYLCADQKKIVPFPWVGNLAFYRSACIAEAAKLLGIQDLVEKMQTRMENIAAKQVHTHDVYSIYADPGCAQYKDMVAKSLALAIHERRLKALNSVARLRLQMPNVNADIKAELEALRKVNGSPKTKAEVSQAKA